MTLTDLMTDTISVLKTDGRRFDDIKARIKNNRIIVDSTDILIEANDLVFRKVPAGREDIYEVIDPGFHEKFYDILAGYQMETRKLNPRKAAIAIQNIMDAAGGGESGKSADAEPDVFALLAALQTEIALQSLSTSAQQPLLEILDAIKAQFLSGTPSKAVVSLLLDGVPRTAGLTPLTCAVLAKLNDA